VSYLKQPAAGLVRLALDRWQLRGMRADNVSAIVIILDSSDHVNQAVAPVTAKCRPGVCRPTSDVLRRIRFRRQRRLGLRTVLGKICRLRAQRNLASVGVMRSPLGSCNRLSAILQEQHTTTDEASLRRPLRRHSYQEACNDAEDAEKMSMQRRRLRVVVRRLSADIGRKCTDLSTDLHFNASGRAPSIQDDATSTDINLPEESVLGLSETDAEDGSPRSEQVELHGTTAVDARTKDNSWALPRWQSTVDLCSPTAVDLPADIQCLCA